MLGITVAPMLLYVAGSAARVTTLEIIEKTADLPHSRVTDQARQELCSAGREDEGAGK
jgi:hypothetical protein